VKERASKRSKVDNGDEQIASPRKTTTRDATKDNDSPKPEDTAAPPTRKRGRPAKTPAADPAKVTATPTRTAGTKKSTVVQPAKETQLDASPVKASKLKRKQSAAPIRHSSNPLDEEPAEPFTAAEADDTVSLAVADLAEPSTRTVGTAFDLTSEQSREAFLRNERWQRDKEARNFNFEGDVHEGRRLRSGKAVVVDTEESGEDGDDGEEDAGDESLDEDERRKRAVSTTTGEKEQEIAVFEADNDYLSQLTYDTTMPVETQKSSLNLPHFTSATATVSHDQPSSSALTPLARKVLRTVISNLAGCETYTPATPMQPEEEKNEALVQLVNLLKGTVERGEGNSCLILGAKGSGKTKVRSVDIPGYGC
jgi:origin recognition complex subunit 4